MKAARECFRRGCIIGSVLYSMFGFLSLDVFYIPCLYSMMFIFKYEKNTNGKNDLPTKPANGAS